MSLFWRLFTGFWLATVLVSASVGLLTHWLRAIPSSDIDPSGAAVLGRVAQIVNAQLAATGLEGLEQLNTRRLRPFLYTMDNQPVGPTKPYLNEIATDSDPSAPRMWIDGGRVFLGPALVFLDEQPLKMFLVSSQPRIGAAPPEPRLIWYVLVGALAAALLAYMLSRHLSRPIVALTHWAGELGRDLDAPPPKGSTERPDEAGNLARELSGMAGRVRDQLEAQRALTRMISHEVRSPLTRLKLVLDLMERAPDNAMAMLPRAHHQISALDGLLEQMLTLSRLDADAWVLESTTEGWPLRLSQWFDEWREQAAAEGIELTCAGDAFAGPADPALVRIGLDNLVRNAIRLSQAGQRIHIEHDATGFVVSDQAGGMDEALLEKAAEPFFQGVTPTGNSGLGLAIVHRIARVHGGQLLLANAEQGLRAQLRLTA